MKEYNELERCCCNCEHFIFDGDFDTCRFYWDIPDMYTTCCDKFSKGCVCEKREVFENANNTFEEYRGS